MGKLGKLDTDLNLNLEKLHVDLDSETLHIDLVLAKIKYRLIWIATEGLFHPYWNLEFFDFLSVQFNLTPHGFNHT